MYHRLCLSVVCFSISKDFGVVYTCEARLTGSAWDEELSRSESRGREEAKDFEQAESQTISSSFTFIDILCILIY